jgi:hypothetical protein
MAAGKIGFGETPAALCEQTRGASHDAIAAAVAGLLENRLIQRPRRTWRSNEPTRATTAQKGAAVNIHPLSSGLFFLSSTDDGNRITTRW